MKSRNNRLFWTALGARILGVDESFDTSDLPVGMQAALDIPLNILPRGIIMSGEDMQGKKGRHVYMYSWKTLRDMGFSRPLRCDVFPGVELFVPFVKNGIAVLPQGFQKRIPLRLRAYALVGKTHALQSNGYRLVISAAIHDDVTWKILQRGGCTVCTPDKLRQIIEALDLS